MAAESVCYQVCTGLAQLSEPLFKDWHGPEHGRSRSTCLIKKGRAKKHYHWRNSYWYVYLWLRLKTPSLDSCTIRMWLEALNVKDMWKIFANCFRLISFQGCVSRRSEDGHERCKYFVASQSQRLACSMWLLQLCVWSSLSRKSACRGCGEAVGVVSIRLSSSNNCALPSSPHIFWICKK